MDDQITFIEAIRRALDAEMSRDPSVYVIGEDVAVGGPFGATKGLVARHGTSRVRNTPISEAAICGMCVGASLCGMRPVVEIMFMDFLTLALDALVNQAAKYRHMSGGQLSVPMVVRTQAGAAGGAAAQHSQSLEAWLLHVPGLVVMAPSSPVEAYGMLRAAIRLNDPVVFVEHKRLYGMRQPPPNPDLIIPAGRAHVVREGTDATVVTYSNMLHPVLEVVERRRQAGQSIEVIDLRTLAPLDMATVVRSVGKTHRLAIVHEAVLTGGIGAEIAARIATDAFDELDAEIVRVGCASAPIAFAPVLESAVLPGHREIDAALDQFAHRRQTQFVGRQGIAGADLRGLAQLHRMTLLGDGGIQAGGKALVTAHDLERGALRELPAPAVLVVSAVVVELHRLGACRVAARPRLVEGGQRQVAFGFGVFEQGVEGVHGGQVESRLVSSWRRLSASVAGSCMSCCSRAASAGWARTAASSSMSCPGA